MEGTESVKNIPARVNGFADGALSELLERGGSNVQQVVGAGVGNDAVPDDGRVCAVVASAARPVGSDVDKEVLGVPGEEAGEVGFEREANDGVFFLFGAVVVRATFDSVCTCSC